ncbi:hypothetical protein D3C76_982630 [compost metagenome]
MVCGVNVRPHQSDMRLHAHPLLVRRNRLLAYRRRLVGRIEHRRQMVLILLAHVQFPAQAGERRGLDRQLVTEAVAHLRKRILGAFVVKMLLQCPHRRQRAGLLQGNAVERLIFFEVSQRRLQQ